MQQNAATGVATLTADDVDQRTRLKALFSSLVGGVVEWYDYFLYGTMAAIVFGPLFFPALDPAVSLALSLATFALAFVVRPLGGSSSATSGTASAGRRPWSRRCR